MARIGVLALAGLLSGCAVNYGTVRPQPTRTADQQQLDTLICKDAARQADSGAKLYTEGFLLGLTIVGTPVAYKIDADKQASAYRQCMQAKGYTVQ